MPRLGGDWGQEVGLQRQSKGCQHPTISSLSRCLGETVVKCPPRRTTNAGRWREACVTEGTLSSRLLASWEQNWKWFCTAWVLVNVFTKAQREEATGLRSHSKRVWSRVCTQVTWPPRPVQALALPSAALRDEPQARMWDLVTEGTWRSRLHSLPDSWGMESLKQGHGDERLPSSYLQVMPVDWEQRKQKRCGWQASGPQDSLPFDEFVSLWRAESGDWFLLSLSLAGLLSVLGSVAWCLWASGSNLATDRLNDDLLPMRRQKWIMWVVASSW